jgi:tetrahydromethanopterin S-methyltransferase subunit G
MFWVFGRTSNVFSSACVVVVRKDDVEEIEKWLNEIDGGVEGLNEMLS